MRRTISLLLIAVTQTVVGCGKLPTLTLPAADQIAEMRISAPAIKSWVWDSEPRPEFVVPPEHILSILFWLNPPEPWPRFSADAAESGQYAKVAEIVIRKNDGTELRL